MYFIGVDVGTTGCKAAIFDECGKSFGKCYKEFDIICRRPVWAEQDPFLVLDSVKQVIKEAVLQAKEKNVKAEEIVALSTSVLGEEIMPVDKSYRPMRDAILGMDYRADAETRELSAAVPAEEIYDITGFVPHPMASLPTIMWMRKNEPELAGKAYKYVTFTEYIMKELGAEEGYIDFPQAGRTMAFDIERKQWSDKLIHAAGMDTGMFCKAARPGQVVGRMGRRVAYELGLTDKVELVAGGQDQTCAALGAGLIDESIGMDSHGTIEGIGVMSKHKVTGEQAFHAGVSCYTYTIPGNYFLMSSCQVGGLLLKWFKNNFSLPEVLEAQKRGMNVYDVMTEHVADRPSSVMVLPHFIGSGPPWNDLDSKGAIVGLTIDSTRHDIVKAIMDSLTYEFKINMFYYENWGFHFKEMRVVGGASNSSYWMQLKANILNRAVSTLKEKDAACLGAAILAMQSQGVYASAEAAVRACVGIDKVYLPNASQTESYEAAFQKYTHLYSSLKEFNKIKL
ncbi:MAG TPA: FGGY-family carbohydrate kinase [Clostridia bacterium]|nr:FGGY-family carbohydrate kinase [Clostridia bacterium]